MGYFVRKRSTGWAVQKTFYKYGKAFACTIPKSDFPELLFEETMTTEEARTHAKTLNREFHVQNWKRKRLVIQERLREEYEQKVPFLPPELCIVFQAELERHSDSKRMKTLWKAMRKVVKAIKIPPEDWKRRSPTIYEHFEKKAFGPDYAKKIIRMMNLWGEFFSYQTATTYSPVKCPTGYALGRIRRAHREQRKCDKASDGLTPDLLRQVKYSLSQEQYRWLYISLWFGLRPQEMRNLSRGSEFTYIDSDSETETEVLNILQTKLINLPEEDQWKCIPIIYPEQKIAAQMIQEGKFEPPLPKTIKRYTLGNHHLYAGRKGFGPLMWQFGHDVVEVSSWLGHKSIDRTFRDYMRWKRLKLRTQVILKPKTNNATRNDILPSG